MKAAPLPWMRALVVLAELLCDVSDSSELRSSRRACGGGGGGGRRLCEVERPGPLVIGRGGAFIVGLGHAEAELRNWLVAWTVGDNFCSVVEIGLVPLRAVTRPPASTADEAKLITAAASGSHSLAIVARAGRIVLLT